MSVPRRRKRKVDEPGLGGTPPGEAGGSPGWMRFGAVLLILAAGVVYANSLDGALMYDNVPHIVENDRIRTLFPPWHLLSHRRPVVELSLAINYALGGLEPWGYHVFNIGVHVLSGLMLYGVLRRLLGDERRSTYVLTSAEPLAISCALLWLVHPLQTQSVTYVIQRGESLMGLFYLTTVYCVLRGSVSASPRRWYFAAVSACALGMCSKAVMVTAPVAVLLLDACLLAGGWRAALRRRCGLYLGLGATWLLLVPLGIVGSVLDADNTTATVGFGTPEVTWREYLLTQPAVLLRYLRLTVWPAGQCLDYGWPAADSLGEAVLPGLVILVLLAVTGALLVRRRPLGAAAGWFFLVLAPTSSFIPIQDPIYEHRMYLPLAGLVVLIVVGAHRLLNAGYGAAAGRQVLVGSIVAATALGAVSAARNRVYASSLRMWRDVVAKRPENERGRYNLGRALQRAGMEEEALREYERAVELNPSFAMPYNNLALARKKAGRLDEAVALFRKVLTLKPRFPEALTNLAAILLDRGELEEARTLLERATALEPGLALPHYFLGRVYARLGEFDRAIASFEQARAREATVPTLHYHLGHALANTGRFAEAARAFSQELEVNPGHPEAAMMRDAALRRAAGE